MSSAWQQYGELAHWLLAERSDEASQRTVISRACYAAYHAASEFVRTHELCPPTQHLTHWLVWRLIRTSGLPNGVKVAKLGIELRDTRVWADYWNPFPRDLNLEGARAVANSAAIIASLQEM
jgi:hypothetical protein